jgi:hypothetical protein
MSFLNAPSNVLTPPTTPDECSTFPQFPSDTPGKSVIIDLTLVTFDAYPQIEFRGRKTEEGILVKAADLMSAFELSADYLRTIKRYLAIYSLKDLYSQDFNSITGVTDDGEQFSEYAQSHELFIKYKGIEILSYNVPILNTFKQWLDSVMEFDLYCYEQVPYDELKW